MRFVEACVDGFYEMRQMVEYKKASRWIKLAGLGEDCNVFPGILKTDLRRVEARGIFVGFEKYADAGAEDGAKKDIGVEHQALRSRHLFFLARQRLKSSTT